MVAPGGSDVTLSVPEALVSCRKISLSWGTLKTRGNGRYPASCTVSACRPGLSGIMQGVLQVCPELPSMTTCAPGGSVKNWTLCSKPGLGGTTGGGLEERS